ncbi:Zn(II)2Cys6 transcription factor [Aspergillus stella-maris]|uniref:Zn(II)2Cys6 transcription factor n=1 Tax=Aspergillus stella-maris TaxID=1810926 RepID=UPI003CCCFAA3
MNPLLRPVRYSRLKSRTGCKTCKIRKVKCGEEKPACLRCSSTGRKCDFLEVSPTRALSTTTAESRERRAFEYYFFHAAPSLSDALDLDFWRGTVLQICGSEPAIWDAVVSLSTFYENPPPLGGLPTFQIEDTDRLPQLRSQQHREALHWYSRSLHKLQDQIANGVADHAVALVSCVLFICIEILQGNVKAALVLYHQASQLMGLAAMTVGKIDPAIMPILQRIGTIAAIVNGGMPLPDRRLKSVSQYATFRDLAGARAALYAVVVDWKTFDCDAQRATQESPVSIPDTDPGLDLRLRQVDLERRLLFWHEHFSTMPEVVAYNRGKNQTKPLFVDMQAHTHGITASLTMTYQSILILVRTRLATTESCYDEYNNDFAAVVSHAPSALAATKSAANGRQPPFVFDMGPGMSLLITVVKCRSPSIRRQALRYLRQAPPLQGMYFSHSASDFLAAIVTVEEMGASCPTDELHLANVLAREGRLPKESERVFQLQIAALRMPSGVMRSALVYTRREVVDGEETVIKEMAVLPARSPHKPLSIL